MDKTEAKSLKKALFNEFPNAAAKFSDAEIKTAYAYAEGYKAFLNNSRTERECVINAVNQLEEAGFVPFDKNKEGGYKAGDKIYKIQRGKALIAAVIGSEALENGVKITASHIDSPRLDLKPNPLYEQDESAFFKTHYYGGIKKYQWSTVPLALRGVICKKGGETITVNIGCDKDDPQFVVTDLLPHLAQEQMKRASNQIVKAEELNVLVGSVPFRDDDESELVKLNILKILNEKYGVCERDFISAELAVVPAAPVRDIGFDRSMIGGYGHDDRVCSYPAYTALRDCGIPKKTAVTVLADKEEIGSEGNTGMQGDFLKYFIEDLAELAGVNSRDVIRASSCISADVTAAYDPTFGDVMDKRNCSYMNRGISLCKYTGSGGKYDSNDASAEFMSEITSLLDSEGIFWQCGEMGKVDLGGGGTVAKYVSKLDIDTVDAGVPVLSMHSPFEVVSKLDLYSTYKAILAYFKA